MAPLPNDQARIMGDRTVFVLSVLLAGASIVLITLLWTGSA